MKQYFFYQFLYHMYIFYSLSLFHLSPHVLGQSTRVFNYKLKSLKLFLSIFVIIFNRKLSYFSAQITKLEEDRWSEWSKLGEALPGWCVITGPQAGRKAVTSQGQGLSKSRHSGWVSPGFSYSWASLSPKKCGRAKRLFSSTKTDSLTFQVHQKPPSGNKCITTMPET